MIQTKKGISGLLLKGDQLLVLKQKEVVVKTKGGVLLPGQGQNAKQDLIERYQQSTIIKVGEKATDFEVGQQVIYDLSLVGGIFIDEVDYYIVSARSVVAVIDYEDIPLDAEVPVDAEVPAGGLIPTSHDSNPSTGNA